MFKLLNYDASDICKWLMILVIKSHKVLVKTMITAIIRLSMKKATPSVEDNNNIILTYTQCDIIIYANLNAKY